MSSSSNIIQENISFKFRSFMKHMWMTYYSLQWMLQSTAEKLRNVHMNSQNSTGALDDDIEIASLK